MLLWKAEILISRMELLFAIKCINTFFRNSWLKMQGKVKYCYPVIKHEMFYYQRKQEFCWKEEMNNLKTIGSLKKRKYKNNNKLTMLLSLIHSYRTTITKFINLYTTYNFNSIVSSTVNMNGKKGYKSLFFY